MCRTDIDQLEVNGRSYAVSVDPVVVVCIDGSEPEYHERAIAAGRMPFLSSVIDKGTSLSAECTIPSFTNPNNMSIATGVPPQVHGVCGNYFFDAAAGVDVMMNDPRFLRAPTIFSVFDAAGSDVVVITAKDKLRRLLGHGMSSGVCFSAERADGVTVEENGIADVTGLVGRPQPSVYSADLSEFVMAAGVELIRTRRPALTYLSLTDYVQHKFAPGTAEADDFYAMLDGYFAQLDAEGVTLVITADHGMSAKTSAEGSPAVVYLKDHLDRLLGRGASHVVLPITDPYTAHHAALGSFAFVHLFSLTGGGTIDRAAEHLAELAGVAEVLRRDDAADRFELPADRIGDLAVVADPHVVLGVTPDLHDLTTLDRPLRSHGGLSEQQVPLIVNRTVADAPAGHRWRNFDAYWLALNLTDR